MPWAHIYYYQVTVKKHWLGHRQKKRKYALMCVILILTFFPDKLLVLNAFKEWFVKSKILTNQMSCWNISRKSYLGLKSVFSRVRRNTTSLQPFICILMKSGVIPGIPQRFTSPSCSATHWPQGWVGSWFADLAPVTPDCWWGIHRVSNIKPLWTQCYWSHTSHQASFQTTPAFITLQVQCTNKTLL